MREKIAAGAMAVLFAIGCGKGQEKGRAGQSLAPPPAHATFASVSTLMKQKCVNCHGSRGSGGIDLSTYESMMRGGASGAIVQPGNADQSVILQALRGSHGKRKMPPTEPLSEAEIKQVEAWIREGAKKA